MVTDPLIARNVEDLTSFVKDLRTLVRAMTSREPTMLSEALRTVAEYAETTIQHLQALDEHAPDPAVFDENDLTILVLLAGYSSGREGMAAATDVIRRVSDTVATESVGETRE